MIGHKGGDYYRLSKENILAISQILGKEKEGKAAIGAIEKRVADLKGIATKKNIKAVVAMHNGDKVNFMNVGLYANLIHDTVGVKRAVELTEAQKNPTPPAPNAAPAPRPVPTPIDAEFIAKNKPDIIYIVDRSAAIGDKPMRVDFFDAKTLGNAKLVVLTGDLWYLSGGGIQSLNLQLDEIAESLK
ncbi:MAG: hypothetical protein ACK5LP_07975 [Campylobacteraceae bacterium]